MVASGIEIEMIDGEWFQFPSEFIDAENTSFETGVSQMKMPSGGPMRNIGNNFEGNGKTITINGQLFDTDTTVVTNKSVTDKLHMKYYLESMKTSLTNLGFKSNFNFYSMESASGTTDLTINGQTCTVPGTWAETKIYGINLTFDDVTAEVEGQPFSLTLWVAGS